MKRNQVEPKLDRTIATVDLRKTMKMGQRESDEAVSGLSVAATLNLPLLGLTFELPTQSIRTIGRARDADFCIGTDPTLSRVHCELESTAVGVYLRNLNSTNGTRVNGQRVTSRRQIFDGDLLCVGSLTVIVRVTV